MDRIPYFSWHPGAPEFPASGRDNSHKADAQNTGNDKNRGNPQDPLHLTVDPTCKAGKHRALLASLLIIEALLSLRIETTLQMPYAKCCYRPDGSRTIRPLYCDCALCKDFVGWWMVLRNRASTIAEAVNCFLLPMLQEARRGEWRNLQGVANCQHPWGPWMVAVFSGPAGLSQASTTGSSLGPAMAARAGGGGRRRTTGARYCPDGGTSARRGIPRGVLPT